MVFFEKRNERREKDDYRFALLAAEIRRGNVKKGARVRMEDFLLNWKRPKPISKEEYTKRSKQSWFGLFGMDNKGKKLKNGRHARFGKPADSPKS